MLDSLNLYDLIGFFGVFLYVLAYALLNSRKIDGNGWRYITINLVAALLVLTSLIDKFNPASFLTQSIWILISLYGLSNIFYKKRKESKIVDLKISEDVQNDNKKEGEEKVESK